MRIIPKKIKVKNTVWKCYSMPDVIVALVMFAIIFASVTTGNWAIAVILGIVSVVMFMPTQDGIFYACILENVKFLFSKRNIRLPQNRQRRVWTRLFRSKTSGITVLLNTRAARSAGSSRLDKRTSVLKTPCSRTSTSISLPTP